MRRLAFSRRPAQRGLNEIHFNTGTPDSGPLIVESIRKLGFDPKDIKILINGHGHMDHAGAFDFFRKLTGAHVA